MNKKKKTLIISLACVAAVIALAAGVWFFWLKDYISAAGASPVYVNPVSAIVGLNTGANPRYSGVVEPQETYKIQRDESKPLGEVLVDVGDEVHVGDVLFRYNTDDLQIELRAAQIAQEGIANQITTLKRQLNDLNEEKKKASKDEEYAYTVKIQSTELQIEQQEYESNLKQEEINKIQESLNSTDVISEVEGVVKEVNITPKTDPSGQPAAFISVLSSGDYRIKGTVSELNRDSLTEGQAVVVHSRINTEQTWKGTVESIDREPASDQNTGMFYYGMDTGEQSSKYNFYVVLENPQDLILGQHVYIEPDLGENAQKAGLWLPAVYVDHDESGSFVWAKNDKDKLEKRAIILGEYDSDNDMYEIKSGVTKADCIAYPNEDLKPGMPTTTDAAYQDAYMNGDPNGLPAGDGPAMTDPGMADPTYNADALYDEAGADIESWSDAAPDDGYNEGPAADFTESYTESYAEEGLAE